MKINYFIYLIIIIFFCSGCVRSTQNIAKNVGQGIAHLPMVPFSRPLIEKPVGIYHKVERGQTLWGISCAYNVSIDDIVKVNKLPNASQINEGQLLFIPGRKKASADIINTVVVKGDFKWPVKGKIISSFLDKNKGFVNKGIDIQCKPGECITASRSGSVLFCDKAVDGYYTILISHGNGYYTVYSANMNVLTSAGSKVRQGTVIAKLADNKKYSPILPANTLHFEIRKKHIPKNPFYFLTR